MKRAFDIAVGGLLLLITLPMILLCALVTAASLRAWPFFGQERVGLDGRVFRFVKIRTLRPSVPAYADKYEVAPHELDAPAFCRLLRRLHLDELPQLALVVLGRMSLVGPRPEMPHLHAAMDPTFARTRTSVRPGCTGLWQVSVGSGGLIGESPEYDLAYVEQRTFALDLWILGRTFGLVVPFGGRALVTLDDVPGRGHRPTDSLAGAAVIDLRDGVDLVDHATAEA